MSEQAPPLIALLLNLARSTARPKHLLKLNLWILKWSSIQHNAMLIDCCCGDITVVIYGHTLSRIRKIMRIIVELLSEMTSIRPTDSRWVSILRTSTSDSGNHEVSCCRSIQLIVPVLCRNYNTIVTDVITCVADDENLGTGNGPEAFIPICVAKGHNCKKSVIRTENTKIEQLTSIDSCSNCS